MQAHAPLAVDHARAVHKFYFELFSTTCNAFRIFWSTILTLTGLAENILRIRGACGSESAENGEQ